MKELPSTFAALLFLGYSLFMSKISEGDDMQFTTTFVVMYMICWLLNIISAGILKEETK